jgi:3-isopropylmalate dehydrogenase
LSVESSEERGVHRCWSDVVSGRSGRPGSARALIGVLPGEGIGPEVVGAALEVLEAVRSAGGGDFEIRSGGTMSIGRDAELMSGRALTEEVAAFCAGVFADGGAVLCGPGGGRFVYDLRRRFDLFCKISPLKPVGCLLEAGPLKARCVDGVDILIVRENVGGVYQGDWRETAHERDGRVCEHAFRYSESQVRRLVDAAASLAARRRGKLAVVVKDGGIPTVSALWRDLGREAASRAGVAATFVDIDLAAYRLVADPLAFDVLAAPNLFGDVLADVGAVLLASRGMSFSGNFAENGAAVYQTNHGSALDLAGQDLANPLGQIASAAMMLRESFGFAREAAWIEAAVEEVLRLGFRTSDIAEPGATVVGTAELGRRVAAEGARRAAAGGPSAAPTGGGPSAAQR